MKYIILLFTCISQLGVSAQYTPKNYLEFDGKKELVFEDNFDTDKPEWHMIPEEPNDTTDKCILNTDSLDYKNGIVYVYNNCDKEVGNDAKIDIDYNRNFEIVLVAKLLYEEKKLDNIQQGCLAWNINDKSGQYNKLFFTGFYNVFHNHLGLDTLSNKCIGTFKALKRNKYGKVYNEYVRYTIRKYDDKYYVFVNGILRGTFPFVKHDGTNIGYGARANSKAEFDFLGVYYLP